MKLERTKNAKRNIFFGIINKLVTLLFPFIIRTVMIKELGAEYLGLNSLFSSILHVLSITELGFSSAVVYSMYKPIADDDTETLCAILNFYKKMYLVIGLIIAILGICVLPFLPKLINGTIPKNANIYLYFIIYLLATVVSYVMFAYKNSLLSAYQRVDITSNIATIVYFVIYSFQIVTLILLKNYLLYLILLIVSSIFINVCTEIATRKLFPNIFCKGVLNKEIKDEIKIKVKGLLINKLCQTSRNSFDSIFISAFLGLTQTAIYNNYYYIMNGVIVLLGVICPALLAGVGNSIVTETQDKNYADMKTLNFIYMWLSGWCTVCLFCFYQPFTEICFGKDMMFPFSIVILFCIYFYILQMGNIRGLYSDAKGLWWENRYRAIIESVANIILNFVLGKIFGIYGIIVATLLSLFIVNFLWGSTIVYKYYFTSYKVSEYFLTHLFYLGVSCVTIGITYLCVRLLTLKLSVVLSLIISIPVVIILPNFIYFVCYFRYKEFANAKRLFAKLMGKIK